MPITDREKEQLQTIIGKMDGMELVQFGGVVYDGLIALKNQIGIQKTIVLGKYISANVNWTNLTTVFPGENEQKSMQQLRLNVLRSAEENILRKLVTIFKIVPEETGTATNAEVAAAPTSPPNDVTQSQPENDPTLHMESVPGGDTELPPPSADQPANDGSTVSAAPLATTTDAGSDAATDAAIAELEMAGSDDDDDPFAGLDGEEGEEPQQPEAATAAPDAEAKVTPTPATTPEPTAKPAEQTP